MSEVNITVQENTENVEIVANNNVIEVNITRQIGVSPVDSVNGQTGDVVLDATDVGAYTTGEVDTLLLDKFDNPTGDNTQYLDGAGTPTTFPSLTGFVPYTGATQDVELGENKYISDTGFEIPTSDKGVFKVDSENPNYNSFGFVSTDISEDAFGTAILQVDAETGVGLSTFNDNGSSSIAANVSGVQFSSGNNVVSVTPNESTTNKQVSLPKTVFNSNTETAGEKELVWNDQDGTLDLGLKGGNVTLQIGQESVIRVVNKTGANLLEANYQAVRVDGAQGNRLKIALAQATTDLLSAETIGLVTETINNNQEGFVTTNGLVRNINTTGSLQGETWADGDMLYLSPTVAGRLTKVKPTAPNHLVVIGYVVRAHATQGQIFVKVDNGYELDELHNVAISSPVNNQALTYNSATDVWENKTLIQDSITDGVTSIAPSQNAVFDALATKQDTLTNPITGTGANGQVAFFNGATTQAGDNGLFWDNTNKRLGIGTTSPSFNFDVNGNTRVQNNLTIGLTTNNGGSRTVFNGSTAGRSFHIANNWNAGNTFEITPSTTNAGSTFTTPALVVNGTTSNIGIGTTSPQSRLDVRAQGALSTDIAFRVRNSADTANLISVDGIGQTIITPSALTGSAATNALDIAQTWNTTGTPTLIRANVTDTASNANSLLMDLRVGNVSRFSMTKSGRISFGAFGSTPSIFADNNGITFTNFVVTNQTGYIFGNGQGQIFSTFGTNNGVRISAAGSVGFVPTSGTAVYNSLNINEIINQTGGANGITRGLLIQPTLTSAADWRSIEWTNNTGRGLWGSGTANNAMAGSLNVGAATNANASAILEATSTTQGFLPPRMTTTQRNAIASPAAGLIVYDTTDNKHYGFNGTTWNAFY